MESALNVSADEIIQGQQFSIKNPQGAQSNIVRNPVNNKRLYLKSAVHRVENRQPNSTGVKDPFDVVHVQQQPLSGT